MEVLKIHQSWLNLRCSILQDTNQNLIQVSVEVGIRIQVVSRRV